MQLIVNITDHLYNNIKALDSISLGRCNYKGIIMGAINAIKNGSTTQWIPVSECLPEEKVNPITMDFYEYPCTVKFGDVYDVRYYKFGRGKWWHGAGTIDKEVIAWQPLPKPYREKESMEV